MTLKASPIMKKLTGKSYNEFYVGKEIYLKLNYRTRWQTSLMLKAAPPLESPSSFVKMAPVIPISRLNVVTKAVNSNKKRERVKFWRIHSLNIKSNEGMKSTTV